MSLVFRAGLLAAALVVVSVPFSQAHADTNTNPDAVQGLRFYVGGDAGATDSKLKFSATGNAPTTSTSNGGVTTTTRAVANAATDLGIDGFAGGAFSGMGYRMGRFYLGGELQADGSSASGAASTSVTATTTSNTGVSNTTTGSGSLSVSREFSVNLGLVGGYYVTPDNMPYANLGYQYTQYHYQLSGSFGGDSGIVPAHGARLAIGDQVDLTSMISARIEYGHVFNGDISYRQGGADHTFQSDSDDIKVGVLFNF